MPDERILLHLLRIAPVNGDDRYAPEGTSQPGIARALASYRQKVVADVHELEREGLVEVRLRRTRDNRGKVRVKTYRLTARGIQEARRRSDDRAKR